MKIRADIQLTRLDEVMAAREAVLKKSDELAYAMGDLANALRKMGVEVSQPADGAAG